jgi:cyclohexyl-isocyanide hydratase
MKIAIPVYDQVDMLDVAGPFEMFDWAGFEVDLVAAEVGQLRFRSKGFPFYVEKTFADAGRYDAVWVPGGDPVALRRLLDAPNGPYLEFLRTQAQTARFMCSVCEGAIPLAAAGLLDGYHATTHWYFLHCFTELFPKVLIAKGHPRFVHDRDRLTGGGISSGLDEALMLITLLAGVEVAREVQQNTQYYPKPPVESDIPKTPDHCPIPPAAKAAV